MRITPARPVLVLGSCVLSSITAADDPVRDVHALTVQWTGLERQKDVLEANWRTEKPILEQQLALLEREARALTDLLEESAEQQDEVEQRRLELLERQTRLEQEQADVERSLVQASSRLRTLHRQLPPPLFEAWAEGLPRLDDPLLTSSEKLQLAVDLLGQLEDFHGKVTLHETVVPLADGQAFAVKQIYLGLSHGWYVTADQRYAAAGIAHADGWRWTATDDAAAVARIVGILKRRLNPELVAIPLSLNARSAPGGN
jgi:hypothetical protein